MSDGGEERQFTVVDELFENYDICLADDDDLALVYCLTCDDIVAEIDYNEVVEVSSMELYEKIIDKHKEI